MPRVAKPKEEVAETVIEPQQSEVESQEKIPEPAARSTDLVLAQLGPQYALAWEDQAKLIRSEQPLNQKGVQLAVQVARSFGLPLQGINVIPSRTGTNVYVNSDGVRWRLHTDPRGVAYSDAEITHRPSREEPWIEVKATIVMGRDENVSTYVNYGVVDLKPGEAMGNAIMRCVTKAKRRTGVDAVGVALPIFEDYIEYAQEAGIIRVAPQSYEEGQYREVKPSSAEAPKSGLPTTVPEFMVLAASLGITNPADVLQITGMADWNEIGNNLGIAALKLQEHKKSTSSSSSGAS